MSGGGGKLKYISPIEIHTENGQSSREYDSSGCYAIVCSVPQPPEPVRDAGREPEGARGAEALLADLLEILPGGAAHGGSREDGPDCCEGGAWG